MQRDRAITAALIGAAGTVVAAVIGLIAATIPDSATLPVPNPSPLPTTILTVPALPRIPVGDYPLGAAVSPNGSRVYITNARSDNVSVIDTASNTVADTIQVGNYPVGVAVSLDGSRAYMTNGNDDTVSVIDTASNTVIDTILVGTKENEGFWTAFV